jgi:hypothetical protein
MMNEYKIKDIFRYGMKGSIFYNFKNIKILLLVFRNKIILILSGFDF